MNYAFNLSVKNENVEEAFNVLDRKVCFCYFSLLQELEHILSVWVFRTTRNGV